jgi:hypothetical protein
MELYLHFPVQFMAWRLIKHRDNSYSYTRSVSPAYEGMRQPPDMESSFELLNKHSGTVNKLWSSSLGVDRSCITLIVEFLCYETYVRGRSQVNVCIEIEGIKETNNRTCFLYFIRILFIVMLTKNFAKKYPCKHPRSAVSEEGHGQEAIDLSASCFR